ncbi:MAG TPA: transcription-repair coupling factor [Candidatus Nanopelagicales bacterium]|nr:transcription-repair coupling factor [Candidatus Nanopelagicales bacterium]
MTLAGLLRATTGDPDIAEVVRRARATGTAAATAALDIAAPEPLRPLLVAALAAPAAGGRPVLAVTATEREAADLAAALRSLLEPETVADFPSWETLPHERLSPSSDTVGRRLATLRRLAHPDPDDPATGPVQVVVAPVRAVLQPLVAGLGELVPVRVEVGAEVAMDEVVRGLAAAAYTRTDLVERRGDFAVRGGILDVFPPTEEHPVRLEFWGDTVEEVRWFRVADQRSLELAPQGLYAPPCRELLLTEQVRARAKALAAIHPELIEMLDPLADGTAVDGMEALAPVLSDGMELLVELLPAGSLVVVCDPERVRRRSHDLVATGQEFLEASWHNAAAGNLTPVDLGAAAYRSVAEVRTTALGRGVPWWGITPFAGDVELADAVEIEADDIEQVTVRAVATESYRGDTERASAQVRSWTSAGWSVVLVTAGQGTAERLAESMRGQDLVARLVPELTDEPEAGLVTVTTGGLDRGVVLAPARLAVLTETDLVGQKASTRDVRRLPARGRQTIDPLQLATGDYVVHERHGVGRYLEMAQRTVAGATREYLLIEYAPAKRGQPGDRLYVPTDQLDQVTRYVGGEAPSLHRIGGADWTKTKGRARRAVRQIAGELIRLYAARMASRGHAFGPDTPWQRELEDAFPYHETPDQAATIDDVKADMEKVVPMDRLICGDVGYGKTEIAVRAAFKAVQDGKQVAVLVPTTLLVQQHLSTFSERYAAFPVKVGALSRFQTDKEAREVIAGIRDGTVDVVIGTHRLFSAEVAFKDLGLVVVDEEQRFGVEHKEHLKAMRTDVDVLSMSATPIPRTLEMAVSGIREMSTIATPPEDRHPVLTFVGGYEERQVAAAIRRELLRDGQVFFVHNRVESIDRVAARLRELVPEARIATAHGQLNEHALEQVMVDFWEKQFDVLVSTTIVESGLDIPNANTLIVDRADRFGLSQLHQIRGRVGRGRERGYAYFLYPPEQPLTETAHDRLATIAQHTDLGSGMAVAMKDLEIRGAGNLLGGEQSGHIGDVGFDLYIRLVGEAVAEYRDGGAEAELPDTKVELTVDAHLPHEYVPEERLRLEAYKRLADAATAPAVDEAAAELTDRYGSPPVPVQNLLAVARFRILARRAGLTEVVAQGDRVRLAPVELAESRALRLTRLYPGTLIKPATRTILVPRPMTARVGGQPLRDTALLDWAGGLIEAVLLDSAPKGDQG